MSATAFQRLRREIEAKKLLEVEIKPESPTLTVKELQALLTEKGIEFDSKAKKADLQELLKASEEGTETPPADKDPELKKEEPEGAE